jgi:DNA-binding response OmpR family regulator
MKKKLLLADDSITIQKVVGIIFATEDYELLTASDGDKAFEMALVHKPDLVIADIAMPGKNGFELCREIKSHPALGTTSVLLLPGAFEDFDEARAVEVCADGWLTKPFESQALIDKVTALFEMPPLRLADAADSDVADEASEGEDFAAQSVAADADRSFATEEDVSVDLEEPGTDLVDEVTETADTREDTEGELWDEVSFEEEDLKPQELLAASDQDEEESADDSPDESDLYEPAQGLTPEQLAPYVSTPPSVTPSEDSGKPEFEPLPDESKEEFEFVTDQPVNEEDAEAEETAFGEVVEEDEPATGFEFEAENTLETDNSIDNTPATAEDDELELMEEDLDQEEELIEDSATFIDLTAAEEEVVDEVSEDEEEFAFGSDDDTSDDEILDLTEGDVLEEDDAVVAAPHETSVYEASIQEHDNLFVAPQNQVADEEDVTGGAIDRHDENPFADVDESTAAAEDDVEPVADATADYEAEFEESDLVEVESEEYAEAEENAAEADQFEPATFEPPLASAATLSSAEMVEEQLQQLSEEELTRIVEKVAGPLIERLAREMLEKTVWEVVPDLAETMISAEIEKIKRGEA